MGVVLFLFIFCCIWLVLWASKENDKDTKECNSGPYVDLKQLACKEIEERKKAEEKKRAAEERERKLKVWQDKNVILNKAIQKAYEKEKSPNIKGLLKSMLETDVVDEFSFNEKHWLFNDSRLRTSTEIEQHEHELKEKYYQEHPEAFDEECKKTNFSYTWIPFVIGFLIVLGQCMSDRSPNTAVPVSFTVVEALPIGLLSGLFLGLIGMCLGHKKNLDKAQEYNINNERTAYERREYTLSKAGLLATSLHTLSHAKRTVKDVANVDSWREMK